MMLVKSLGMLVASALTAGTLLAAPDVGASPRSPVPLAPGDCDWMMFDTGSVISQDNGIQVKVEWGDTRGNGEASYLGSDGVGWRGQISNAIVRGTDQLRFTVRYTRDKQPFDGGDPFPPVSNDYTGTIAPNGSASGTTTNSAGVTNGWTIGGGFRCIGEAPADAAPPPAPSDKPIRCTGGRILPPGSDCSKTPEPDAPEEKAPTDAIRLSVRTTATSVTATVTNSAPIEARCNYTATNAFGVETNNRDFTIAPNGTEELNFPGFALGATYHVVVSCSGEWKGVTQQIGRVEQDVTF